MARAAALGAGLASLPGVLAAEEPEWGGRAGAARVRRAGAELRLGNDALSVSWDASGDSLRALRLEDRLGGRTLALPADVFTLRLGDGRSVRSSGMRLAGAPREETLAGEPGASRLVERLAGKQLVAELEDAGTGLRATWRAILRDGGAYVRQEVELRPAGADVPVREIVLLDLDAPGARVSGSVKGSPVVAGNLFLGFEHPLSESAVAGTRAHASLPRELPLRRGTTFTVSSVLGTTPPGQLRRGFLRYVERERAHPYRPFLHYNSWYDIGYFSKYDEAAALGVIHAFGRELNRQRGVTLDSFLFDDGWDDARTLWHFHSGFPRGFGPIREAAAEYGAAPGVWLSPWGGYGQPKQDRLAYGRAQGFETNEGGFALSGPKYYARFPETCLEMIRKYGVNQFKIDGTGNASRAFPGSVFDSDFDAALHLIAELRAAKPDLFVNLTTGTYPSPFWLRHADSIWRGGEDHDFAGVGSDRQRWITYRDGDTFRGIVSRGPLFPLNSLMLHGMIYARSAHNLNTDPRNDFPSEVRAYFGTGTQLQEMYITPALLKPADWEVLAESANWARRNADPLSDTHWVGGDPRELEPYGHAAWSPTKGILVLRNPGDAPKTLELDVAEAFELPQDAPGVYAAASPWRADRGRTPVQLRAGTPHSFELAPFEVLTLEATPAVG
jgi:hypothetical protein